MPRPNPILLPIALDPAAPLPLHRQLYQAVRAAILAGRLAAGTRLPASRTLAGALGVSRNTVMSAYEQLLAEGYIGGQIGSGTYVSSALPDVLLRAPAAAAPTPTGALARQVSRRGALLAATPVSIARDQEIGRASCIERE